MKKDLCFYLVDDDSDEHLFFAEALATIQPPATLVSCMSSDDLFKKLNLELPDALFIDINLPAINGFEMIIELKKNSTYNDIPVIIYSTSSSPDDLIRGYSLGAVLYFKKENSIDKLAQKLKRIVTHLREQSPLEKGDFERISYSL